MIASTLILGPSGAGKTSSLETVAADKNLNGQVYLINTERKDLPFKGKLKWVAKPKTVKDTLDVYKQIREKGQKMGITCVIMDSFSAYLDLAVGEARQVFSGFDIWSEYAKKIGMLFAEQKELNDIGIHSFMIAHDEVIRDEGSAVLRHSAKVKGKEWEGMVEKEFNMVLYAQAKIKEGTAEAEYKFMTNTNGKIPAKSPKGMFPSRFIDNDLKYVIETINAYGSESE